VILQLEAYPAETTANKLSTAYTYPEVRFINARLRVRLSGFSDARKLTVFLTTSEDSRIFEKKKLKENLTAGTFNLDIPEVLDLKEVFGEHKVKLFVELALSGAHDVNAEVFFQSKGRDLPKVDVLSFRLFPDLGPYGTQVDLSPGGGFFGELVFRVQQPGDSREMVRVLIRLVGVIEDEGGFHINPQARFQEYDTYWDEIRGPQSPGTYILSFRGHFPRYFYEFGSFNHPFSIHAFFQVEDETVCKVALRDYLIDRNPGEWRDADNEVLRTIQLEPARRWRLRTVPSDYRPQEEIPEDYYAP